MDHEFWHARWERHEIGFHEGAVNRYLKEYWPALVNAHHSHGTVLAPLCGKARDLWWLYDRGHAVIGVEISAIACKDFFEEAEAKAKVHPAQPFIRYAHDRLELWCGDFFQLVPEDVRYVRHVYDRAALIALPPTMRQDYVDHLTAILPDQVDMLLITLDYTDGKIKGPPFKVSDAEVTRLFEADFDIQHILTNPLASDHPFLFRKGLRDATESVFWLTRRDS